MDQRLAADMIAIAASIRSDIEAMTDDIEVVRDTLEGAVDLDGVIDYLLGGIASDEALAAALGQQIAKMNKRIKRINERVVAQRALIRRAMKEALWEMRERPLATITLGKKPASLGKLDEAKIPSKWWVESEPTLNKRGILEALVAGEAVPGAELAPEDVILSIRGV